MALLVAYMRRQRLCILPLPAPIEGPVTVVTSFNKPLFRASGRFLLRSLVHIPPDWNVCVCHERDVKSEEVQSALPREAHVRMISDHPELRSFCDRNADIIRTELGGRSVQDRGYMNNNLGGWYHKILALSVARAKYHEGTIIWLDCDCELLCEFSRGVLACAFAEEDVFYHRGWARAAIESGIMGFKDSGLDYLDQTIALYATGEFRSLDRWDDGALFTHVLGRHVGHDVARASMTQEVMDVGLLKNYIRHRKGTHAQGDLKVPSGTA